MPAYTFSLALDSCQYSVPLTRSALVPTPTSGSYPHTNSKNPPSGLGLRSQGPCEAISHTTQRSLRCLHHQVRTWSVR